MHILSSYTIEYPHFNVLLFISTYRYEPCKFVVHKKMVGGSSMIWFPLVIAVPEQDMPEIEPGPLGWLTSALTNELQEVRQ